MPLGENALKHYYLIVFSFLFAVPVVFTIIMYSVIARELNRKPADCSVFCAVERRQRKRENKKVIKMMVAVVIVFVVSYAPSHFLIFCSLYAPLLLRCNKLLLHAIVRIVAHCNCAANPIIYFIISKNYRLAAKALFKGERRWLINRQYKQIFRRQRLLKMQKPYCAPRSGIYTAVSCKSFLLFLLTSNKLGLFLRWWCLWTI